MTTPLNTIKIISAGAGSGKTYRLTQEMVNLLQSRTVRPDGIIATTFTNKAAAELQERVRLKLLENGLTQEADELTNALIGTVHGLGVKLLKRFAYEAGVSPDVSIIADEDQQLIFNQSLATILTEERVEYIEQLCQYLGLSDNAYFDWRKEVKKLTDVARSNDFSIDDLEDSKRYSFESFSKFLSEQREDAGSSQQLRALLEDSIEALKNSTDATKKTKDAVLFLQNCNRELKLRSYLPWPLWAKLTKLQPATKSKELIKPLTEWAALHDGQPVFHKNIKDFIAAIFDTSIAALQEYDKYKRERGLIDYIDMEVRVKLLLKNPRVAEVLSQELDLLMVDEFQDTSPIQLEIFFKLSRFARYSVWVGDPKQSIYGFRGADPALMQALIGQLGGIKPEDIQRHSWRSREDIVYATNALFTKAFPQFPTDQVALIPKRRKQVQPDGINKENEPLEMTSALLHWHFKYESETKKGNRLPGKPWMENCIANSLVEYLEQAPTILPKGASQPRKARPGDVAILCRSNAACLEMAEALHRAGLQVSISRAGLLNTAEAQLILACLRLILNSKDVLSTAEILKLAEGWTLEQIIENRLDFLEEQEKDQSFWTKWAADHELIQAIAQLRIDAAELSTTETLELLLDTLDLRRVIRGWGNTNKRLDNVDILLQMGSQYEENCNRLHTPASLGGFLLYLNDLEAAEEDKQGAGKSADAVEVLTYHRSKGLEWPIVICHDLEKALRAEVWGINLISRSDVIDFDDILGNRWVRYWINPYGAQWKKTPLYERIQASDVQKSKEEQANQEEARLMYVGITRARDYLIFPSTSKDTKWLNRIWHEGREDFPTLDPDSQESPWIWENNVLPIDTMIFSYDKNFEPGELSSPSNYFFEAPEGPIEYPRKNIHLRNEKLPIELKVNTSVIKYAAPLALLSEEDTYRAAKVAKAFLAAFHKSYDREKLLSIAEDLVARHEVEELIEKLTLVKLGEHWWIFLEKQYPVQKDYRKFPIHHVHRGQVFNAVVDLVLETGHGLIVVQHSSFSGDAKNQKNKALELADWMYLTREALKIIFNQKRIQTFVHFVVVGTMIEIDPEPY